MLEMSIIGEEDEMGVELAYTDAVARASSSTPGSAHLKMEWVAYAR
jgi:hypothetical protein